jgi:serine/threonine-protein kinase HipA
VTNGATLDLFQQNLVRISISGVQEKFSVLLEKNKLRLVNAGERGSYILKPIPNVGKNADQMPANEHLTMQIARQVYGIETAENALIFFKSGEQAYITKRFDVDERQQKRAVEDFASLAGRTPQTHGEHYKYLGNYLELFGLLRTYLPIYKLEAPKLFKLIFFNYLFSNGDAHFKNFSLIETPMGDFQLSPAYDLLNSRLHVQDSDFALDEGLLPKSMAKGKVVNQFYILGKEAGLADNQIAKIHQSMLSNSGIVETLISASYLNERSKRNYLQAYQAKLKTLASAIN